MTTNHDIAELCKRLRYDLTAAQGKLSDILQALEGANVQIAQPWPAVEQIRRQIHNGVIRDHVDLAAELSAWPQISDEEADQLRALLTAEAA